MEYREVYTSCALTNFVLQYGCPFPLHWVKQKFPWCLTILGPPDVRQVPHVEYVPQPLSQAVANLRSSKIFPMIFGTSSNNDPGTTRFSNSIFFTASELPGLDGVWPSHSIVKEVLPGCGLPMYSQDIIRSMGKCEILCNQKPVVGVGK